MKRKIIAIQYLDCGKTQCLRCDWLRGSCTECGLFAQDGKGSALENPQQLKRNSWGYCVRCVQCLEAEKDALTEKED